MSSRKEVADVAVIITAMTDPEERWFGSALGSVLRKTMLPKQIIVLVCEGNTWAVREIEALSNKGLETELVHLHPIQMALLGSVRNTGVGLATTGWVTFLDGDDVWMPEKLERQMSITNDKTVDFVGTDFVFITAEDKIFGYSNGSTPTPSSWMVRTKVMKRFPFDPKNKIGEDHIWLMETKPHVKRVRVPRVLVQYRIREGSISAAKANSLLRLFREMAARLSRLSIGRILILGATYLRYRFYRHRQYDV